jgi:cytochrome c-type biogenesis protein CcmH
VRPKVLPVLAALALVVLASQPASAAEPRASLPDIEDEVMCTICGTLLEESQSPQADRERALIRRLIAQGDGKQQIKDALVAQYGPDVLALPEGGGFNISSWLVPLLALLLAAVGVGLGIVRVRRRESQVNKPVAEPTQAEQRRLDAELSAFDR